MKKRLSAFLWTLTIGLSLMSLSVAARTAPAPADTCVRPAMPVIVGSARTICRGDSVTLQSTALCAGTVIWSTGQTGLKIGVRPQQTTRYTAVCRTPQGCVSCYADVWKVTIQTPEPPALTTSASLLCAGDAVTVMATNCAGTVVWPDGSTGLTFTDHPTATTNYTAYCQRGTCRSNPARAVTVQITTPTAPSVQADLSDICLGQTVRLWATGCLGTVRWSDGQTGADRNLRPDQSTSYRAVCQIGTCRSDSSLAVTVRIRTDATALPFLTALQSECPFQTVNLARALPVLAGGYGPANMVEFYTGPSLSSARVQSVGAVLAGTYYIFQHSANGCLRGPVAVSVTIPPCANPILPCQSNPPGVAIRLDSINVRTGVIRLVGALRGSAMTAHWATTGTGLFTDTTLTAARYVISEEDRSRGMVTFSLTVPDPDAAGPCTGESFGLNVPLPSEPMPTLITLGKQALAHVWNDAKTVTLTYKMTVRNNATTTVSAVQVADNLTPVLLSAGVRIVDVAVRADSGWVTNPAYTGVGADTTLLLADRCTLQARAEGHVWLTINADVSQASTLTFSNIAFASGRTDTGVDVRDQSTNGLAPGPNPTHEPTVLTVPPTTAAEASTVFVPEGFSPNGDGINDAFVVGNIPTGQTVFLTVYNRWGQIVFQQNQYANDWNGTSGTSRQNLPDGTYFYVLRLSGGHETARFMTISR